MTTTTMTEPTVTRITLRENAAGLFANQSDQMDGIDVEASVEQFLRVLAYGALRAYPQARVTYEVLGGTEPLSETAPDGRGRFAVDVSPDPTGTGGDHRVYAATLDDLRQSAEDIWADGALWLVFNA